MTSNQPCRESAKERYDELDCFVKLSEASSSINLKQRQREVTELLGDDRFLNLIVHTHHYWRGNFFVVKGLVDKRNTPLHWHWHWDDRKREPARIAERVALPFLQYGTTTPLPASEREQLERNIIRSSRVSQSTTGHRLIKRVQQVEPGTRNVVQKVTWGEIVFFKSVEAGQLCELKLSKCKAQPRAADEMLGWLTEAADKGNADFRDLVAVFKDLRPDIALWSEDFEQLCEQALPRCREVFHSSEDMQNAVRFDLEENGITQVGQIICFETGDFISSGEQCTGYALLESFCPHDSGIYNIVSLFGQIAQVGVLSVVQVEHEINKSRVYMHGFAKPTRPLGDAIDALREAGLSGNDEEIEKWHGYAECTFQAIADQAEAAMRRDDVSQSFDLRREFESLQDYYNFHWRRVALHGLGVTIQQRRIYLKSILYNAVNNSVSHGKEMGMIHVLWSEGPAKLSDVLKQVPTEVACADRDEITEAGQIMLVIVNEKEENTKRDGNHRSQSVRYGTLIIEEMAALLGGHAFQIDSATSFVQAVIFPTQHPDIVTETQR